MRGDQLTQQWHIIRAIEASLPNGLNVTEIAGREEIGIRAIYGLFFREAKPVRSTQAGDWEALGRYIPSPLQRAVQSCTQQPFSLASRANTTTDRQKYRSDVEQRWTNWQGSGGSCSWEQDDIGGRFPKNATTQLWGSGG